MITADMRAQMRRLVLVERWCIETVARRFGVHHSTVRRALIDVNSADAIKALSALEPYKPFIVDQLTRYPELTSTRLLQELRGRGYTRGVSVVRRYVAQVRRMLDDLEQTYNVDRRRIYATGYSNGAMLCYRLACELSDRIAAIAPVSGTMGVEGPKPKRPVPVLHIHGLQDRNVPFVGGKGENQFQPNPHRSVDSTLQWWRKVNLCEKEPKLADSADYERVSYTPDGGGADVELYKIKEGGHTWPGGSEFGRHLNVGRVVKAVPASQIIWDFFKLHPMESDASKTGGK